MPLCLSDYDFLDFGCSNGDSMAFARDHLNGGRGLGLDIDPKKIEAARSRGFEVEQADLTIPLQYEGNARFSIISHFLEHVSSPHIASKIIVTACLASRDFVLIRQPWFDSDGPLASLGLKCFWSDWTGHTNQMLTQEMYLILLRLFQKNIISGFRIYGHVRMSDTTTYCLIPLDSPPDSHHYSEEKHGPKAQMPISFDCFREQIVIIGLKQSSSLRLPSVLSNNHLIFSK